MNNGNKGMIYEANYLFVFSFFCLLPKQTKKGPIISYSKQIINLGVIKFKDTYTDKILIKNQGDEVLKITNTSADCACIISKIEKSEIKPNDSTYIVFNMTPKISGYIQQSIFVDNNSKNENRVLFLIRANVSLEN